MGTFEVMTCDEAIEVLRKMKKNNKNCKVAVTSFDFEANETKCMSTSPERVCVLVQNSNTVIMNGDDFLPHMQLYSRSQIPENIVREGIMHDVLLRIVSWL